MRSTAKTGNRAKGRGRATLGLGLALALALLPAAAGAEQAGASRRDEFDSFPTPILKAIAIGLYAPSAHNTQSWKFRILGDREMLFYVNEKQLLPATDPPLRQIHISAGCFLEALALGCTGLGYTARIELFPEGIYESSEAGRKPVASVRLVDDPGAARSPLWEAIFQRRTNRGIYSGEMMTQAQFEEVLADCSITHSRLSFVHGSPEMARYNAVFRKAMEIEFNTLGANEETRAMFRFTDREAASRRDGLTYDANGITGIAKFFAQLFTSNTQKSWNSRQTISAGLGNFNKGLDSSRGYVLQITEGNGFEEQVLAGRDFYQFWLALTRHNYYLHPLNQANEEYPEMDAQRAALDRLAGTGEGEKIQMIARMGRGDRPFESYRRHVESFIME